MFPTITILDTLDKGGKDAYSNPSMVQAASRVPDNLFDKSLPVPDPKILPKPTHPLKKTPSLKHKLSLKNSKTISSKNKASKRSKILPSIVRSKSSKAGLLFPVTRIKRRIKSNSMGLRIGNGSAIYMAAIL